MRYKNWKIYFAMASEAATGGLMGIHTFHWPLVANIRRDPFEGSVGFEPKTLLGQGGALTGPMTAYIYDWNIIPIGQALWLQCQHRVHFLRAVAFFTQAARQAVVEKVQQLGRVEFELNAGLVWLGLGAQPGIEGA